MITIGHVRTYKHARKKYHLKLFRRALQFHWPVCRVQQIIVCGQHKYQSQDAQWAPGISQC